MVNISFITRDNGYGVNSTFMKTRDITKLFFVNHLLGTTASQFDCHLPLLAITPQSSIPNNIDHANQTILEEDDNSKCTKDYIFRQVNDRNKRAANASSFIICNPFVRRIISPTFWLYIHLLGKIGIDNY